MTVPEQTALWDDDDEGQPDAAAAAVPQVPATPDAAAEVQQVPEPVPRDPADAIPWPTDADERPDDDDDVEPEP